MRLAAERYQFIIVGLLALAVTYLFFAFYNPAFYYAKSITSAQLGYSLSEYGTFLISRASEIEHQKACAQAGRLVDLVDTDARIYQAGNDTFPVNDTVAYGALLACLWSFSHSYRFFDVQLLQLLLYLLSLLLYYYCAYYLFGSSSCALICTVAQIFFFSIVAMAAQPISDIWAYFGAIVLLTIACVLVRSDLSRAKLILAAIWFACCQWIRPALFFALLTMSFALFVSSCLRYLSWKKYGLFLVIFWSVNIAVFWLPFGAFNKQTYGRYIVGPFGQDLLEGLGEFPNTWGYRLDDQWIAEYIGSKYGVVYGSPEFDDAARAEFDRAYQEDPLFFFSSIVRRVPQLIVPSLAWVYTTDSPYGTYESFQQKIAALFHDTALWRDFLARHMYIRLYLLLGYLGIILVCFRRNWAVLLLLGAIVCGGFGKLPSHIEARYLVPFYWVFSFFVGYVLWLVTQLYSPKKRRKNFS